MGNPLASIEKGSDALMYFQNRAIQYENYGLSFDDLKRTLGTEKQIPIYLEGFGDLIDQLELSDGRVKSAMEGLADAGKGKVPTRQAIFDALGGKASEISWIDLTTTVAAETAKQVAQGAQAVGETVIDTAKSLNAIIPIMLVGALVFILLKRTRQIAG